MKKNLLIIPAGPGALFQEWETYNVFDYDVAIINWTGANLRNTEQATYLEHIPGQKWKIVAEFCQRHDVTNYNYIWILDDDCLTTPEGIEATFNFCKENNLDMAQPALTPDSFKTHPSTFLIPGAKMHITDTVEIMCPIFSKAAWPVCSEHFGKMPAGVGYGLEGYWAGVLDSKSGVTKFGGNVAVIDLYPVKHTKQVTGPAQYHAMGINPDDDGHYFANLGHGWTFNTIEVIV